MAKARDMGMAESYVWRAMTMCMCMDMAMPMSMSMGMCRIRANSMVRAMV